MFTLLSQAALVFPLRQIFNQGRERNHKLHLPLSPSSPFCCQEAAPRGRECLAWLAPGREGGREGWRKGWMDWGRVRDGETEAPSSYRSSFRAEIGKSRN